MAEKLPLIQIQYTSADKAEDQANRASEELDKIVKKRSDTPDTKTFDVFGGTEGEYLLSQSTSKLKKRLAKEATLYEAMGMPDAAAATKDAQKNIRKIKKQKKAEAKKETESIKDDLEKNADKAIAKADKYNKKLTTFTASRRADIQAIISTINDIPDRDTLEDFVVNYFLDKTNEKWQSSKIGTKATEAIAKKMEKNAESLQGILEWSSEIMSLYQASQGISLDNVVSIVTSLVTIQFRPYIDKYNQYVTTVKELAALIQEYTLIVDAINSKATSLGSPMTINLPTLPEFPVLPEIPV